MKKSVEFFRFHNGHPIIGKSDERIIEYCLLVLAVPKES